MKQFLFLAFLFLHCSIFAQETFDSLLYNSDVQVNFESDKHTLDEKAISILDSFSMLYAGEMYRFTIHAHTDDVGSDEYNIQLSGRRADALKDHLLSQGVGEDLIQIQYFGEQLPIQSNESESGRQANRRATIKAYDVIELQWLTGVVKDEESGEGISAFIKLHSKTFENHTKTDSSGQFKIAAPAGEVVGLDIRAKGFLLETKMMRIKPLMSIKPIQLPMPRIAVGKGFSLDRLFFEGNKDVLKDKSAEIFNGLLFFMQDNDEVCIEIGGHINLPHVKPVTKASWNNQLSIARAKKVHDLLHKNNINRERMLYKGYGNSKMVYPKANEEFQMAKNRRVEIEIIDCSRAVSESDDELPEGTDFSTGERKVLNSRIN